MESQESLRCIVGARRNMNEITVRVSNWRIFLKIVATYWRSLFVLVCGLFISRWALVALGKTDLGLYGVVGGMAVMALLLLPAA